MIEIRRILCPVDFSDSSRRALDHAMAVARWYGASVTGLHVAPLPPVAASPSGPILLEPGLYTPELRQQLLADTRRLLESEQAAGVTTDAVVVEGAPAPTIVEHAAAMGADLLVMGTHGRSGFDRLLLGSVAEKVLRRAGCPVLTVPPGQPDVVPAASGLYKRILCAVDFADSSLRALRYAMSIAREADADLTVLHVVPHEFDAPADLGAGNALAIAELYQRAEEAAQRRLDELAGDRDEACRDPKSVLARGKSWREILRVAAETDADLIVMGVQGRGAVDLALFGSTTQHVVRGATCPVLTLRAA